MQQSPRDLVRTSKLLPTQDRAFPINSLLENSVAIAGLEAIKVIPQNVSAFRYPHPLPFQI